VAQKFDFSTKNLSYKKYKYIADEVFIDLAWRQRHTLEWKATIMMIVFLFYFRLFVHYTGQMVVCSVVGAPITKFQLSVTRAELVCATWEFWQVVFVVCSGAIANTFVFIGMILLSWATKLICYCFPPFWYHVLCWYGIYCFLDPVITFFFDTLYRDFENGDMFQFFNYFEGLEGNGATGVFITIILIGSIMMFSGYCFYRFMVFYYKEGRILDLYRRITGSQKSFFLPHDNEVSLKYLQWVMERYRRIDCVIMSEMRILKDKLARDRNINFVQMYAIEDGTLIKNRLFFKDFDGSIIEVPQKKVMVANHELKKIRKEASEGSAHLFGDKYKSINQLIKNTYKKNREQNREFGLRGMGTMGDMTNRSLDNLNDGEGQGNNPLNEMINAANASERDPYDLAGDREVLRRMQEEGR
jgi:hypothetical protein